MPGLLDPARINVLYAGRLTREKGVDLLADAFLEARRRATRRCTSCSPAAARRRRRCASGSATPRRSSAGSRATRSPPPTRSADLFLFCSQTDTYGQVLLEAQASGLPVVAVAAGGPAELVAHGRSGLLCSPDARALGLTLAGLAGSPSARRRLAGGGLRAVQERSWEAALGRLAEGWQLALAGAAPPLPRRLAAYSGREPPPPGEGRAAAPWVGRDRRATARRRSRSAKLPGARAGRCEEAATGGA